MIFTSQSGLIDTSRSALWDAWYIGHLEAMASVPGIGSAQRFGALDPAIDSAINSGPPPSLAMYSIASLAVFESAIYLRTRGMGPWQTLIDPRHYRRNLFDGLDTPPAIAPTDILLVIDRATAEPAGHGIAWLRAVGLDRTTPYRGIAITADVTAARALAVAIGGAVALYRPVTRRYTAS